VFATMRNGVQSFSPIEADRSFMELGPLLLAGVCERLARHVGPADTIIIHYEKVIMLVTRLRGHFLAVTLNRKDAGYVQEVLTKLLSLETVIV